MPDPVFMKDCSVRLLLIMFAGLVASCGRVKREDVVGTYSQQFRRTWEWLVLKDDGSFVQDIKMEGVSYHSSGTWRFKEANILEFDSFLERWDEVDEKELDPPVKMSGCKGFFDDSTGEIVFDERRKWTLQKDGWNPK
jgi:hypothetical protein